MYCWVSPSVPMKELQKSFNIWCRCAQWYTVFFLLIHGEVTVNFKTNSIHKKTTTPKFMSWSITQPDIKHKTVTVVTAVSLSVSQAKFVNFFTVWGNKIWNSQQPKDACIYEKFGIFMIGLHQTFYLQVKRLVLYRCLQRRRRRCSWLQHNPISHKLTSRSPSSPHSCDTVRQGTWKGSHSSSTISAADSPEPFL